MIAWKDFEKDEKSHRVLLLLPSLSGGGVGCWNSDVA